MRRREFLISIGSVAIAWPLAARAQQATMPVIGFLDSRLPEAITDRLRGFRQGLKDTGYVDGHRRLSVSWILILSHVTGKKHPKLPRFSTLFKGLARDPKIPSCIY